MAKEKKSSNRHEITVKIEGKDWENALEKSFQKNVKNVTVDGFRKGKCPRNIFEKKYGKESLYMDAAELVVEKAYNQGVEENKELIPVTQPSVNIKSIDDKGVEFVFTIITQPEVTIQKYKGLKVAKDKVEVTKEEVAQELSHLLEQYTELVVKEDGKLEEGNVAIIDFEGFLEGKAFDGGKGENYSLEIGSHTFIPGFEEQLVGMKTGEEKEIQVTFPENYQAKDLAGKLVTFRVKVNEIKEKEERTLDSDFFADLGMEGVDSKETLEKELKKNLKAQKEMEAENKYIDQLLSEICKHVEVDIPEEMVDDQIHLMIHRFEDQLKMQGISLDMYYQFTNTTHEDLHQQLEKEAYQHVLERLTLEEIIKLENVTVSEQEVEEEIQSLSEKYGMKEEELLKNFGSKDMIKYDLKFRKVIEILKEANK